MLNYQRVFHWYLGIPKTGIPLKKKTIDSNSSNLSQAWWLRLLESRQNVLKFWNGERPYIPDVSSNNSTFTTSKFWSLHPRFPMMKFWPIIAISCNMFFPIFTIEVFLICFDIWSCVPTEISWAQSSWLKNMFRGENKSPAPVRRKRLWKKNHKKNGRMSWKCWKENPPELAEFQ